MEEWKKEKHALSAHHSGEENSLSKPWLAPNQWCNLRLNHRKGCRVHRKCVILLLFLQPLQNKIIPLCEETCCQTFVHRIRIHWTWSLLPDLFPVSLNILSAMVPDFAMLTWAFVFQSPISHPNYFLVTGQREQHDHKSRWTLYMNSLKRCIARGFEMQRRRRMCLHDAIVFIHQKQIVERGSVVALFGYGRWLSTKQSLGGTPI